MDFFPLMTSTDGSLAVTRPSLQQQQTMADASSQSSVQDEFVFEMELDDDLQEALFGGECVYRFIDLSRGNNVRPTRESRS